MRTAVPGGRGTVAAALLLLAAAPACAGEAPPAGGGAARDPRRAEVRLPSGRTFAAEIADTPERWARGYMHRRDIADDDAMIFVFPEAGVHPFWMKNTLVALDIIWMDDDAKVVHVERGVPPCRADPCPSYGPPRKARYVLELRAGATAREALAPGDRIAITFPEPAR